MTALWLYGRGRAAHQPAPLIKVSGANAQGGWRGGATCFRGLHLSSDSSAARGIKRPRVRHGLLMWLHLGGWGIIPSVWVYESSEARKHEPAHFRTLLSVVCNGKVWQSLEKEEANGGVKAPTSLVSRKTSQIRIRAAWDGVAWIFRSVWKNIGFQVSRRQFLELLTHTCKCQSGSGETGKNVLHNRTERHCQVPVNKEIKNLPWC